MPEDKPRYSRVSDILDLAIFMSSKAQGVTLNEIATRYNVSRRTAERMRDSLTCIFPQVDEIETGDSQKHWGFVNYSISQLISFTPKELANIEQYQRRTTNHELKSELAQTVEKIKALSNKNKEFVENNIELFMQTEGYALRQMPQYKIDISVLKTVRDALRYSKIIECTYHDKQRLIEPLGMIYGEKIYLVAREKAKGDEIYNYLLHKFENFKLTDKSFDRGQFDLQEYTNRSFGVYHGEILDVELLFSKDRAKDAMEYDFHPTQSGKLNNDGSYTLKFSASGSREILWHLFKWGKDVKIISPKSLQKEYLTMLSETFANQTD